MDKELIKEAIDRIDGLERQVQAYEQVLTWIADGCIDPTDGIEKVAAILAGDTNVLPNPYSLGQSITSNEVGELTKSASISPEHRLLSQLNSL